MEGLGWQFSKIRQIIVSSGKIDDIAIICYEDGTALEIKSTLTPSQVSRICPTRSEVHAKSKGVKITSICVQSVASWRTPI